MASVAHSCLEDMSTLLFFFSMCCLLVTCPGFPDVPHAYVSEETKQSEYQVGQVIHFTCELGYISGPVIRYMCTDKGWFAIHGGKCYCELNGFLFSSLGVTSLVSCKSSHFLNIYCYLRLSFLGGYFKSFKSSGVVWWIINTTVII